VSARSDYHHRSAFEKTTALPLQLPAKESAAMEQYHLAAAKAKYRVQEHNHEMRLGTLRTPCFFEVLLIPA